jgi:hypothetical protein
MIGVTLLVAMVVAFVAAMLAARIEHAFALHAPVKPPTTLAPKVIAKRRH